jgi:hypothetical protein
LVAQNKATSSTILGCFLVAISLACRSNVNMSG